MKCCKEGHLMDPSWKQCPVCAAPLSGWLVQLNEGRPMKVYPVHEGKSFAGSAADCEIRILGGSICRQHIYLTVNDGLCTMVDMGNGDAVKVNNGVTAKTTLIDGDVIEMGGFFFKVKLL